MYYDNVLKEGNVALHFPSFKNGDRVQKLVASMRDDQTLGEWEVPALGNMRWNDNQQCPIKCWSRDIIESMGWLMLQPACAKHQSYAAQHCFNSDTPPKCLYIEMHTADWLRETQVTRETLA